MSEVKNTAPEPPGKLPFELRILDGDLFVLDNKGKQVRVERMQAYINAAAPHIAAQAEEIKRLLEALEPFSREADEWATIVPDDYHPMQPEMGRDRCLPGSEAKFSVGDLRRARAIIAKTEG